MVRIEEDKFCDYFDDFGIIGINIGVDNNIKNGNDNNGWGVKKKFSVF